MKKLLYTLIGLSVVLTSCDNRKDVFELENTAPEFTMNNSFNKWGTSTEFTTLDDSVKAGYRYYLDYSVSDLNTTSKITSNTVFQFKNTSDADIDSNKIEIENGVNYSGRFYLQTAWNTGLHETTFTCEDNMGAKTTINLNLMVFANLKPVCGAIVINTNPINTNYDYEIAVTDSYDRDERFGGKINEYEYTIDNQVISAAYNKIQHTFPGPGTYNISVRVKDNNNEWSEIENTQYTVL